jgi:hypothetical protein
LIYTKREIPTIQYLSEQKDWRRLQLKMEPFALDITKPNQLGLFQPRHHINPLEKIMFLEYAFFKTKSKEIAGDLIRAHRKYKRTLPIMLYDYVTKKNSREAIKRLKRYKKNMIPYDEVI